MKRRYRIRPSEKAGYTPGKFVVQYYDPGYKLWFDAGDPMPSEEEAAERIKELEEVLDAPTPASDVTKGDQLLTTEGPRTVVGVEPTTFPNKQKAVRIVYETAGGFLKHLALWPNSTMSVVREEAEEQAEPYASDLPVEGGYR